MSLTTYRQSHPRVHLRRPLAALLLVCTVGAGHAEGPWSEFYDEPVQPDIRQRYLQRRTERVVKPGDCRDTDTVAIANERLTGTGARNDPLLQIGPCTRQVIIKDVQVVNRARITATDAKVIDVACNPWLPAKVIVHGLSATNQGALNGRESAGLLSLLDCQGSVEVSHSSLRNTGEIHTR
jgi:hypothetical protein